MLQRTQDFFRQVQQRVHTTLQIAADLAASLGLPLTVQDLLRRVSSTRNSSASAWASYRPTSYSSSTAATAHSTFNGTVATHPAAATPQLSPDPSPSTLPVMPAKAHPADVGNRKPASQTNGNRTAAGAAVPRNVRKRAVIGDRDKSSQVRNLTVDDAIDGSTYLARIVWALGVAQLEGLGSLRPADMARMIMSRSPVSLEPPNVARYIRRSQPSCIAVDREEGSSSFYKLNTQGQQLFNTTFCAPPAV